MAGCPKCGKLKLRKHNCPRCGPVGTEQVQAGRAQARAEIEAMQDRYPDKPKETPHNDQEQHR